MLWVLSKIQRTVSRGFSALQPVFKKSKVDILRLSEKILPDFIEN